MHLFQTFGPQTEEQNERRDDGRDEFLEEKHGSVWEQFSESLHHLGSVLSSLPSTPLGGTGGGGEVVDVGQNGA